MSGRDTEPVAAFFPSIDRNLMRDLDRHFRGTSSDHEAPAEESPQPAAQARQAGGTPAERPRAAEILEAVDHAAASMHAMSARIHELELHYGELESINNQLRIKLGEVLKTQQATEAALRDERERAERAEAIAAHHLSRAQALESDLEDALTDLRRIAEAISGTLGSSST